MAVARSSTVRIASSCATIGSGPTLVLVHGFPTSSFDYGEIIEPTFAARFRCVTFDLLGFGASSKPHIDYDYDRQTEVLAAVARAEGVERAVVVAHDYGVTVGQELLARELEDRAPFQIAGMVLLNGGLSSALHRPIAVQRLMASRIGGLIAPLVVGKRTFARSLRKVVRRIERMDLGEHYEALRSDGGVRVMPRLLQYMAERKRRGARWEDAIRRARPPLAFVWGLDDPISGAHMLDWARGAAPAASSTFTALAGIGHYPQVEDPDAVAAAIAEHAARVGR